MPKLTLQPAAETLDERVSRGVNELYNVSALLQGARSMIEELLPQNEDADRLERILALGMDLITATIDMLTTPGGEA